MLCMPSFRTVRQRTYVTKVPNFRPMRLRNTQSEPPKIRISASRVAAQPQLITDGEALRQAVRDARQRGQSVGLVPTMGALHDGHLSLVDAARAECDLSVVTIFVNPTQFAPNEDFREYPREPTRDLSLLAGRGCDIVFAPAMTQSTGQTMRPTSMSGRSARCWKASFGRPIFAASPPS